MIMEMQIISRMEVRITTPMIPSVEFMVGEKKSTKGLHGIRSIKCDGSQKNKEREGIEIV